MSIPVTITILLWAMLWALPPSDGDTSIDPYGLGRACAIHCRWIAGLTGTGVIWLTAWWLS